MRDIETMILDVLRIAYHIDININGILVYWTIGVFIEYCEFICNHDKRKLDNLITIEMIVMASITIVMKFCHEDNDWKSSSKVAFKVIGHRGKHDIDNLLNVEMDILTKINLIECFEKYCPNGYALRDLTFIKIDIEEKKE